MQDSVGIDADNVKSKMKFVPRSLAERESHSLSLPGSLDPNMVKLLGKNLLSNPTEIYDKYKEACCHYAKVCVGLISVPVSAEY